MPFKNLFKKTNMGKTIPTVQEISLTDNLEQSENTHNLDADTTDTIVSDTLVVSADSNLSASSLEIAEAVGVFLESGAETIEQEVHFMQNEDSRILPTLAENKATDLGLSVYDLRFVREKINKNSSIIMFRGCMFEGENSFEAKKKIVIAVGITVPDFDFQIDDNSKTREMIETIYSELKGGIYQNISESDFNEIEKSDIEILLS